MTRSKNLLSNRRDPKDRLLKKISKTKSYKVNKSSNKKPNISHKSKSSTVKDVGTKGRNLDKSSKGKVESVSVSSSRNREIKALQRDFEENIGKTNFSLGKRISRFSENRDSKGRLLAKQSYRLSFRRSPTLSPVKNKKSNESREHPKHKYKLVVKRNLKTSYQHALDKKTNSDRYLRERAKQENPKVMPASKFLLPPKKETLAVNKDNESPIKHKCTRQSSKGIVLTSIGRKESPDKSKSSDRQILSRSVPKNKVKSLDNCVKTIQKSAEKSKRKKHVVNKEFKALIGTDLRTIIRQDDKSHNQNLQNSPQVSSDNDKSIAKLSRCSKELKALQQDFDENIADDHKLPAKRLGRSLESKNLENKLDNPKDRISRELKALRHDFEENIGEDNKSLAKRLCQLAEQRDLIKSIEENNVPLIRRFNKFFVRRISRTYSTQNETEVLKKDSENVNINKNINITREIDEFLAKESSNLLEVDKTSASKSRLRSSARKNLMPSLTMKKIDRRPSSDSQNRNLKISFLKSLDLISSNKVKCLQKDSSNRRSKRINISLSSSKGGLKSPVAKTDVYSKSNKKNLLGYKGKHSKTPPKKQDKRLIKKYAHSSKNKRQKDQLLSKPLIRLTRCSPKRIVNVGKSHSQRKDKQKGEKQKTGRSSSWSPLLFSKRLWANLIHLYS